MDWRKLLTRGMAGPSTVCKSVRAGFDSLPRLQITRSYDLGRRFYRYAKAHTGRSFFAGLVYEAYRDFDARGRYKEPGAPRLYDLVREHHAARVDAQTKFLALRDKHVALSRELSAHKRSRPQKREAS